VSSEILKHSGVSDEKSTPVVVKTATHHQQADMAMLFTQENAASHDCRRAPQFRRRLTKPAMLGGNNRARRMGSRTYQTGTSSR